MPMPKNSTRSVERGRENYFLERFTLYENIGGEEREEGPRARNSR